MLEWRPGPPVILSVTDTLNRSNKDQHLYTEGVGRWEEARTTGENSQAENSPSQKAVGKRMCSESLRLSEHRWVNNSHATQPG